MKTWQKKGNSVKINAKVSLSDASKNALSDAHSPILRHASSDCDIATIDVDGVIKGQSKGECVVYIYAQNGHAKKVKVMVN